MKTCILALILGLVGLASQADPLPDRPHVYVEGSAAIKVVPDTITFSLLLEKEAEDIATAKADVDQRSRKLIETCEAAGVSVDAISTTFLNVQPNYEYEDGNSVIKGSRVSREIDLTITDLEQYPSIMTALVEADIAEIIQSKLSVADEKDFTDQALTEAMADASARAERLAASQGKRLGDPYSISEFDTRSFESGFSLRVSRKVVQQSSNKTPSLGVSMSNPSDEIFEPGVMTAQAHVFVVFLLE